MTKSLPLLLLALFGFAPASLAANPPNVVLVFIDDMGWGDFSCFGNEQAATPNIDRLAAEGLRFEHFYVNSPICSPSRVAISTGQYPQRWRISSFLSNRKHNKQRGMAQWLDPKAPMFARALKAKGYATGHFGKWHMGGQRDVSEAPLITEYGFDRSLTNFEGLGDRVLPLKYTPGQKQPKKHALGSDNLGRGEIKWQDRSLVTEDFTSAALKFIKTARAADKPFYVNLWPDDVHTPMHPPLPKWGDGKNRTLYHAVLETMDAQFAPLFDHIRSDKELANNTIIVICSDNGPEVGFGSPASFHGHKATLFEGGIRSPLVVWAPGLIAEGKAGTKNASAVLSSVDLVASLHTLCGSAPPEGVILDGEKRLDTFLGKSDAGREQPLFFRRPPDRENFRHYKGLPDLAVRDGNWKLLCDYGGKNIRLHDLSADSGEKTDLAEKHPEIAKRLTSSVLAWHASLPPDSGSNQ